jgi:hypothetical protein
METKKVMQMDIFGGTSPASKILEPHELPKPINGHAISLLVLMHHPKKWLDMIFVITKYKYPKWQTRLAEICKVYPNLVEKRKKTITTRFGNNTDITEYKLKDYNSAYKVYMEALNIEGGMYKVISGVNVLESTKTEIANG